VANETRFERHKFDAGFKGYCVIRSDTWAETSGPDVDVLQAAFRGARFLIAPGHFDYFGGAERQAVLLAEELIGRYQCHVDFLGWGGDGVLADKVRAIGSRPFVFALDQNEQGLRRIWSLFRLARFIRKELRPEYLLPFVGYHCKVIGSIWKHTGARFTWWNQRDEGRLIHGTRTEHRLLRSLPAVVSNSFEGRDFLIQKFGLAPDRVRVINNGVEIPVNCDRTLWRTRLGLKEDEILFAMLANLTQYKDHATLLKAFAILRKTEIGRRCRLVFAGQYGDTTQMLKAMAFDLGLCDSLTMLGAINDTTNLLAASDIVVHSSTKEGCPNGALEAMALGKCVLGTDISGMRQAIGDSASGRLLAPAGDFNRLAELMAEFASSSPLRDAVGEKNLARIQSEFTVEKMTREVLQTILEHRVR
jgi:glycosyltransferase involved in cell wall biosynthesis